jgi:hypothetical protein
MFIVEEVRRLIDGAGLQLRAMILLGINAGFGNSDCANLPLSALWTSPRMVGAQTHFPFGVKPLRVDGIPLRVES